MTGANGTRFDVAVIGAGPVGSVAALTHARRGAKVVLLEANPRGAQRLAGEWLHPLAVEALRSLDIDLAELGPGHTRGNGFVLYPDDGSEAVVLPYAEGSFGASCPHSDLVKLLRRRAAGHVDIDYWEHARVTAIDDTQLTVKITAGADERTIRADRIVGADGRNSIVRNALRLPAPFRPNSRMVGVKMLNVELPFENFGHVFLGGPGPVLLYRISDNAVRLIADIPFRDGGADDRAANLFDAIGPLLPHSLRAAFETALASSSVEMAVNAISPRIDYGEGHYALVGDATGHYHPLTALGMTLGFDDAVQLAETSSVAAYRRHRLRHCRVPEMVAVGIYDAFSERGSDAAGPALNCRPVAQKPGRTASHHAISGLRRSAAAAILCLLRAGLAGRVPLRHRSGRTRSSLAQRFQGLWLDHRPIMALVDDGDISPPHCLFAPSDGRRPHPIR